MGKLFLPTCAPPGRSLPFPPRFMSPRCFGRPNLLPNWFSTKDMKCIRFCSQLFCGFGIICEDGHIGFTEPTWVKDRNSAGVRWGERWKHGQKFPTIIFLFLGQRPLLVFLTFHYSISKVYPVWMDQNCITKGLRGS